MCKIIIAAEFQGVCSSFNNQTNSEDYEGDSSVAIYRMRVETTGAPSTVYVQLTSPSNATCYFGSCTSTLEPGFDAIANPSCIPPDYAYTESQQTARSIVIHQGEEYAERDYFIIVIPKQRKQNTATTYSLSHGGLFSLSPNATCTSPVLVPNEATPFYLCTVEEQTIAILYISCGALFIIALCSFIGACIERRRSSITKRKVRRNVFRLQRIRAERPYSTTRNERSDTM